MSPLSLGAVGPCWASMHPWRKRPAVRAGGPLLALIGCWASGIDGPGGTGPRSGPGARCWRSSQASASGDPGAGRGRGVGLPARAGGFRRESAAVPPGQRRAGDGGGGGAAASPACMYSHSQCRRVCTVTRMQACVYTPDRRRAPQGEGDFGSAGARGDGQPAHRVRIYAALKTPRAASDSVPCRGPRTSVEPGLRKDGGGQEWRCPRELSGPYGCDAPGTNVR